VDLMSVPEEAMNQSITFWRLRAGYKHGRIRHAPSPRTSSVTFHLPRGRAGDQRLPPCDATTSSHGLGDLRRDRRPRG
jgi:hypothetical protein